MAFEYLFNLTALNNSGSTYTPGRSSYIHANIHAQGVSFGGYGGGLQLSVDYNTLDLTNTNIFIDDTTLSSDPAMDNYSYLNLNIDAFEFSTTTSLLLRFTFLVLSPLRFVGEVDQDKPLEMQIFVNREYQRSFELSPYGVLEQPIEFRDAIRAGNHEYINLMFRLASPVNDTRERFTLGSIYLDGVDLYTL